MKWVGIVITIIGTACMISSLWNNLINLIAHRSFHLDLGINDNTYRIFLFGAFIGFGLFMHIYGKRKL